MCYVICFFPFRSIRFIIYKPLPQEDAISVILQGYPPASNQIHMVAGIEIPVAMDLRILTSWSPNSQVVGLSFKVLRPDNV